MTDPGEPERVELQGPPAADLPKGDCCITRFPGGAIVVDHADPRLLISAELIATIEAGQIDRWLPSCGAPVYPHAATFERQVPETPVGGLLRIRAANRTVIYRITAYVAAQHAYIGEWPD